MNAGSPDLAAYARAVAPHVDRLAIAVHKHVRPAGRALVQEFGLRHPGVLVDARATLLAGPIALDDLAAIERYVPRDELAAALEEHVGQGLLTHEVGTGGRYVATPRGRDFLRRLTAAQGETITALWAARAAALPVLVATATRAADHAAAILPRAAYPAFHGQDAAPDPAGATPAHLLLTRLTTLRYLRADAHAAAWRSRGLDAAQGAVFTALWRARTPLTTDEARGLVSNGDAADRVLETLHERGLTAQEAGGWRISAAGRALRDAIERDTDRGAAPPFVTLAPPERTAFLTGLERLA